jgi:hypothetical protein
MNDKNDVRKLLAPLIETTRKAGEAAREDVREIGQQLKNFVDQEIGGVRGAIGATISARLRQWATDIAVMARTSPAVEKWRRRRIEEEWKE